MPLLSTHHSSGSSLKVSLHPLVLLTISDHITRHALRHSNGVIVGALLGQQSGRNITLEYAFECNTITSEFKPDEIILHDAWFKERLQQYKDVHKEPALELVGWFTTAPSSGPEAVHLPIHQQILQNYNETAVLLCIHPQNVADGKAGGGKLPLTIYESVHESGELGEKGGMEIDGDPHENARLDLRFRELAYNIETGEAEMIGVDFVAKGGGNATAVETGIHTSQTQANGKGKGTVREAKIAEEVSTLSVEDEELIASLSARASAVRMLHTRINLLKSYLTSLPPSYLTTTPTSDSTNNHASTPPPESQSSASPTSEPNHPLLRSICALLARLPLLTPPTPDSLGEFKSQSLAEKADVGLVSLLGTLGNSIKDTRELGRKFGVVETARTSARKQGFLSGGPGGGAGGPMVRGAGAGAGGGPMLGGGGAGSINEEDFGDGSGSGMGKFNGEGMDGVSVGRTARGNEFLE